MIWARGATGVFKSSAQCVAGSPMKCPPASGTLGMVGGDEIQGDRCGPGTGEVVELAVNGIGDGETAYVDDVLLDVPTDSVLLVEEEKSSESELVDSGLYVGEGGGRVSSDIDTGWGEWGGESK